MEAATRLHVGTVKPPEPLTERDIERAFGYVVPDWQIERLDTTMGTEQCAKYLKSMNQVLGVCTIALDEDGEKLPYGGTQESWSFHVDARSKGIEVRVEHHAEYHGPDWEEDRQAWHDAVRAGITILRAGKLPWTRFANMATIAACELKYAGGEGESRGCAPAGGWGRPADVGDQLSLI